MWKTRGHGLKAGVGGNKRRKWAAGKRRQYPETQSGLGGYKVEVNGKRSGMEVGGKRRKKKWKAK